MRSTVWTICGQSQVFGENGMQIRLDPGIDFDQSSERADNTGCNGHLRTDAEATGDARYPNRLSLEALKG